MTTYEHKLSSGDKYVDRHSWIVKDLGELFEDYDIHNDDADKIAQILWRLETELIRMEEGSIHRSRAAKQVEGLFKAVSNVHQPLFDCSRNMALRELLDQSEWDRAFDIFKQFDQIMERFEYAIRTENAFNNPNLPPMPMRNSRLPIRGIVDRAISSLDEIGSKYLGKELKEIQDLDGSVRAEEFISLSSRAAFVHGCFAGSKIEKLPIKSTIRIRLSELNEK